MSREFFLGTPHGVLLGELTLPPAPRGVVLVATLQDGQEDVGILAASLAARSLGILSIPLLTSQETQYRDAAHNVPLLTEHLVAALDMIRHDGDTEALPLGIYAEDHAVPAAIRVAALRDAQVGALACRGGLVDLAGLENLRLLAAPLLMVIEEGEARSLASFQRAAAHISPRHHLVRPSARESAAEAIARWFGDYLQAI